MSNDKIKTAISKSVEVSKIYATDDYDLFGYVDGNRDVNENHVKRIIKSFKKFGYHPGSIVICIPNPDPSGPALLIIDGQHRYEACKEGGHSVIYTIIYEDVTDKNELLNLIFILNQSKKDWVTEDHIHFRSTYGNIHYQNYEKIKAEFPEFEDSILFHILSNKYKMEHESKFGKFPPRGTPRPKSLTTGIMKDGRLELTDSDIAYLTKRLSELQEIAPAFGGGLNLRYYVKGLDNLFNVNDIDKDRLVEKITTDELPSSKSLVDSIKEMANLYNKGKKRGRINLMDNGKTLNAIINQ